jgi:4-diphosphocytidyl-2-C-methyl-D-erythritol kinase
MNLSAPAKINLHLRIGPRRSDGFHSLLSWMAFIGLFDNLSLTAVDGPEITLTCDDASLPCDGRNLVMRAARELGGNSYGAKIHLEKRIPAGGGLGGGSSDAATTLLGLNRLWNINQNIQQLSEIAGRLGSDVPFFLFGSSSICKGRGEAVRPIGVPTSKWVTLVLPPIGMPTAEVYGRFDAMGLGNHEQIEREPDWATWLTLKSTQLLPLLVNDLELPAFSLRPELADLRTSIEKLLSRTVRMSGSGSSLFTLFDDQSGATAAAETIVARHNVKAIAVALAPVIANQPSQSHSGSSCGV